MRLTVISLLAAWLLLTLWTVDAVAQTSSAPTDPVDALLAELEFASLDDSSMATSLDALEDARAAFVEARRLEETLDLQRQEADELSAQREALEARPALGASESLDAWLDRLPVTNETQTLEELLANQRNALDELDGEIDTLSQQLVDILSGPASAAAEVGALEQRIARLETETPNFDGSSEWVERALALRRQAELKAARAALELREFQQGSASLRQNLFELSLRDLHLQRERYEERVEILQTRLATQGRTELDTLVEVLTGRAEALADGPEVVASTAATNADLATQLAQHSDGLAQNRIDLVEAEETRDQISSTLRDARTRLEVGGTSQVVGRWLWSERQRLESPASIQRRLGDLRDDLATLRLDEVVLSEQRGALEDRRALAQGSTARGTEDADGERTAVATTAALAPLLRQQFELLTLKEPLLRQRIVAVEDRERALVQQAEDSLELQRLFDRYLLSAPSHVPIDLEWLQRLPESLRSMLSPAELQASVGPLGRPSGSGIALLAPGVILLFVLFRLRHNMAARIATMSGTRSTNGKEADPGSFRSAMTLLAWTLVAALPVPLVIFLVGAYLQDVAIPGGFGHAAGLATRIIVLPLYAALVIYQVTREQGLGPRQFRWSEARCRTLRRVLPALILIVLPMAFLAFMSITRGVELSSDYIARLAIMVASLTLAATLWYALGPQRLWTRKDDTARPSLLRKLLRVTLSLFVASVAWFAAQGFVYSASSLLGDLLLTFSVLVAVSLTVGLISRWLLLGERRLAASREEEADTQTFIAEDPDGEITPEPELSLEAVNAQTGRLLSALRIALVLGAVVWVWSGAFPAITRLEEIVLWHVAVRGIDGQPESQAITLLAILSGLLTLMITVAGARNLPGLIEIILANYTNVDAPSRYAVTSVLRYAIVIFGTLLALSLIGMQWSRLQWLAAGLTVGLGFGLQEIFANFISGLILLFERPFRVGDIITVGDLSGLVTRVRTRATTILDFDNREIVIPNKEFITGQLVNWTLSDSTTRLTVTVGVAYGTSPPRVHALLRQAAREHPLVLKEPEPMSWFMEFGPSSLDFNLLVFVATPRDRFRVKDGLNTRIATLFAENDIEIAFPQLDVHVRTAPEDTAPPAPSTPKAH